MTVSLRSVPHEALPIHRFRPESDNSSKMDPITSDVDRLLTRIKKALIVRFSLRVDQADDCEIDKNIREGVELNGTYLWILMCAILIASIGLNINSTAVIIGAMLISPLMGPIMGIGYGVGIYDFRLIHKAFKNLAIATVISFITSALYFYITPLSGAQSELLARTSPNIWDLLIALFGGMAGIIGATRKEKSNVIPGVAIATALMPPICTAAYGFVNGNVAYFLGASYLYLLNCIYIAVSSILIVWFIRPIARREIDEKLQLRIRLFLVSVVFVSFVPSVFIAVNFVHKQVFERDVSRFVNKELVFSKTFPIDFKSSYKNKTIDIVLVGKPLDEKTIAEIENSLPEYGLAGTRLVFKQVGMHQEDINAMKTALARDILEENRAEVEKKEQILQTLQENAESAEQKVKEEKENMYAGIAQEIYIQYPQIHELFFADAYVSRENEKNIDQIPTVIIVSKKNLAKDSRTKIEKWLKFRFQTAEIEVIFVNR